MEKRGQTQQIFTYIFALVVAGLIIGFGYYAITNVLDLFHKVDTIKFNKDFEKQINIYYDFAPGTNGNIKLRTPDGIKAICFVDQGSLNEINYPDVKETAKILQNKNVFFSTVNEKDFAEPTYVSKFRPVPDPLCINTLSGVLDIDLTTVGKWVELTEHQK